MARTAEREAPASILSLTTGLLAGPLAWLVLFGLKFVLVPWMCTAATNWPLYILTLAGAAVAAGGCAIAWKDWRASGREWPDEEDGVVPRSRFVAALGALLSGFFVLVIVAQGITDVILGACQ